jgi:hypothetical protein
LSVAAAGLLHSVANSFPALDRFSAAQFRNDAKVRGLKGSLRRRIQFGFLQSLSRINLYFNFLLAAATIVIRELGTNN